MVGDSISEPSLCLLCYFIHYTATCSCPWIIITFCVFRICRQYNLTYDSIEVYLFSEEILQNTCWVQVESLLYFSEINECASDPCQNGGHCIDHINKYECDCEATKLWKGTHCEVSEYMFIVCYLIQIKTAAMICSPFSTTFKNTYIL